MRVVALEPADAAELCDLLTRDNAEYRKYFEPFEVGVESVQTLLRCSRRDRYWGIWTDAELIGFFMLRGFDEGYRVPSYGVYIAQSYANKGLSKMALQYALAWCRLNDCEELRLSVHPDNLYARRVYEKAGFQFTGQLSKIGHSVYRHKL